MKSHIATALAIVGLVGGTGGAIAIADTGGHPNWTGGAASGEYKPGKGCGDRHHSHYGPPGNPDNITCPPEHHPGDHHGDHGGDHHDLGGRHWGGR